MKEYIVRKEITLNASPSAVWDALTNPEKTKKYFFNCEVHSDWKPGGSITFKGTMFLVKKIEMHGTILQVEPGKLLQYNLQNSGDNPSQSIVTDTLQEVNGKTLLTITDDVGSGDGGEERYEKSLKGWDKVLEGLQELVEENE